jgi:tRNA 2-selenouridine synthase
MKVWLIGQVAIPDAFYTKMRDLPVYFLDVPLEERTKHLVTTYASLSHDQLADAISRITKGLDTIMPNLLKKSLRREIIIK